MVGASSSSGITKIRVPFSRLIASGLGFQRWILTIPDQIFELVWHNTARGSMMSDPISIFISSSLTIIFFRICSCVKFVLGFSKCRDMW